MLIKYNTNNISHEKHLIDVSDTDITVNDSYVHITVTTKTPHRLQIGDVITLNRNINNALIYNEVSERLNNGEKIVSLDTITGSDSKNISKTYFWLKDNVVTKIKDEELDDVLIKYNSNNTFKIENFNFTSTTFSISCPIYYKTYINKVHYGNGGKDSYDILELKDTLPDIYDKGEDIILKTETNKYTYLREENWDDLFYECKYNPENSGKYIGYNIVKFAGRVYQWGVVTEFIDCQIINGNFITTNDGSGLDEQVVYIKDNRFIENNQLRNNVSFYELMETIRIALPLSSNNVTELNDENITKYYFETKKQELIPEIIDHEKMCFSPYYVDGIEKMVSKIRFNIFLRDRDGSEEWVTNDSLGWNQYKMNDEGTGFIESPTVTKGDLLAFLNFTDEDIYFRKKKVDKTFIRLSFYDSNNPVKQMLLFYSTIFLDSSELYSKYIKNLKHKTDNTNLVNDLSLGDDNLTLSFIVNDKYDMTKSSEGFYLYLYPEDIKERSKTIYMKVEFNHAGYGQTLPLIYPNKDNKPLSFKDKDFPKSLLDDETGDLSEFYRQLYIPITVKYDGEYKYFFNIYERNDDEITINLYEPKINSLT